MRNPILHGTTDTPSGEGARAGLLILGMMLGLTIAARRAVQHHIANEGRVPVAIWRAHPLGACGLEESALTGQHYIIANGAGVLPTGELEVVAIPLAGDYPVLRVRFLHESEAAEIVDTPHPGSR